MHIWDPCMQSYWDHYLFPSHTIWSASLICSVDILHATLFAPIFLGNGEEIPAWNPDPSYSFLLWPSPDWPLCHQALFPSCFPWPLPLSITIFSFSFLPHGAHAGLACCCPSTWYHLLKYCLYSLEIPWGFCHAPFWGSEVWYPGIPWMHFSWGLL